MVNRGERGSELVEVAFELAFILLLFFMIIQFGWTAAARSSLEAGIEHMIEDSAQATEPVSDWARVEIAQGSGLLSADDIRIESIDISDDDDDRSISESGSASGASSLSSSLGHASRTRVVADVIYDSSLFSFTELPFCEVEIHVDDTRTESQDFEAR